MPDKAFERVADKVQQLANNPRPDGVRKLRGTDHEYRIRIGGYRVRYEIDDEGKLIVLLQCKHRKDSYR
ncbi:MAG: type II toxin-antitoxin system RelE/ParE family toxin [Cyanobacteria bacterium J06638_22]